MKRLITLLATTLFLFVFAFDVAYAADDVLYIQSGNLDGGNWEEYNLQMEKQTDGTNVYTYKFTQTSAGNVHFRVRILWQGNESGANIIAPLGNSDIPLTADSWTSVTYNGNVARSFYFSCEANKEYTIKYDLGSYNGGYNNMKLSYSVSGSGVDIPISGIDPNAYYLVSPELTGGELLPSFKMIASRNRTQNGGDGKTSTQFFTINFKKDEIQTMTKESSFHWYISKGDGTVTYRPGSNDNDNYQLGLTNDNLYTQGKNNNVKAQYREGVKTTDKTNTKVFEMPINSGVSYTIFLNAEKALTMNINQNSLTKYEGGYYLIGNFTSATSDVSIDPHEESMRRKMTLYRYKEGFRYEEDDKSVTDATADSLVYMVHVEKPVEGWGNLYMDVAPAAVISKYNSSWVNNADAWNEVIRPQVSIDAVDARALKGGLVEGLSGVLMSLNPEVDGDLYSSYDFSMNLTTSTYRLVFNTNLYIVGEAVSTMDGTKGKSFDLTQKIPLTYNREEDCYKYEGDGSMLHFENGKEFRFVVNGETYKVNYSENANEPYTKDGDTYSAANVNGETQYRNTVSYHNNGSTSSTDPGASADGNHNVTFALGTGNYVLRFFLPQDNQPYYTITQAASLVVTPGDEVYSWGDKISPKGNVILTDNGTTGNRGFIFTVDGSTPQLVDGSLPTTTSASGTNVVIYEHTGTDCYGSIPDITSTNDKKIMFSGTEISSAISASGNVTVRAYAIINDPDNEGKYKVSGDMVSVVYKFRDEVRIEITEFAGKFLRTFSYGQDLDLPADESVKAYEAYRYAAPTEADKAVNKHGLVYLRRIKYIPANEGVVLWGDGTTGEKFIRNLTVRTEGLVSEKEELWWKDYSSDNEWNKWNNYLVPTVTAVPDLGNVELDEENKIIARYFGLGSFYETNEYKNNGDVHGYGNYVGFFRLTKNGRCGANKAYLRIPAVSNEVSEKYGYIDFNGQWLDDQYDSPDAETMSFSKTALVFDDWDLGETTVISNVMTAEDSVNEGAYYTIQGVKVAKPVQGIYIHNGKKVIIK